LTFTVLTSPVKCHGTQNNHFSKNQEVFMNNKNGDLIKSVIAVSSGNTVELQNFSKDLYQFYFDRKESTRNAIEKNMEWIPSSLRGVFKTKLAKANEREQLTDLQAIAEQERHLLAIFFGTMIQYTKLSAEKLIVSKNMIYNNELKELGQSLNKKFIASCSKRLSEITTIIEGAIVDHSQKQARLLLMAEQYRNNKAYYDQLKEHIDALSKTFFSLQNKLLTMFQETLDLELQSGSPNPS
jgi:hypothetical protein